MDLLGSCTMVSKVVFIILMELFLVCDLFWQVTIFLFVCYVFCFTFTQGDIPKHLGFFWVHEVLN
jgi:hypothetical protein